MNARQRFFFDHAGYSYSPPESPLSGRTRCAELLASAEEWARDNGWRFAWERDQDSDEHGAWHCFLYSADGALCQSLSGITFDSGEPWGESYRRVVEAELAHQEQEARK